MRRLVIPDQAVTAKKRRGVKSAVSPLTRFGRASSDFPDLGIAESTLRKVFGDGSQATRSGSQARRDPKRGRSIPLPSPA